MVQIWVDLDCSEVYDRYKEGKLFDKSLNSNDFFFVTLTFPQDMR